MVGAEDHLPYDRPPLSKEVLRGEREPDATALRPKEKYVDLDAELILGRRATALDVSDRVVSLEGELRRSFDGLVIATGATPRMLPGTTDLPGVHVLRSIEDCLALRAELEKRPRVVVVGAGFIGSEVAATCRQRGLEVTVLEALPVPLERALGASMGGALAELHLDHGVDLRCGTGVEALEGAGRVERVRLDGGGSVEADVVVVGIGVVPATGWLASSGLPIRDGVVCDATCATPVPGVVAAGDVCRWYNPLFDEEMRVEHWDNAAQQGRAAALTLLAGREAAEPFAPVPYFWSDQYDRKIQFIGRGGPGDDVEVVHGTVEEGAFVGLYGRAGRLVGALAVSRPRLLMRYRNMIADRVPFESAVAQARQ